MDSTEHTDSSALVCASPGSDKDISDGAYAPEMDIHFGGDPLFSAVDDESGTDYLYSELQAAEKPSEAEGESPSLEVGDDDVPEMDVHFGGDPSLSEVDEVAGTEYLYSELQAAEEPTEAEGELPSSEMGDDNNGNDNGNGIVGGDGYDSEDAGPRNWRPWLYTLAGLILIAGIAAFIHFFVWSPFDDDDDDSVSEVPVAFEDSGLCRATESVDLSEVGVLNYGDSLVYNVINPFWTTDETSNGDAQVILEGAVTELFEIVGDGCTPAGTAYWRNILPHSIDADRVGLDNYDATSRVTIYQEDADTRVAVTTEIVRQLSECTDVQFVNLTVEDAPRIYVAAYAADYNGIVFVQTPLLQLDTLPSGDQGLTVIRCSFGKIEGSDGDYVNYTLISPSLRAIVYLESPMGNQVFMLAPDTDEDEQDQDQPDQPTEAPVQEALEPTDTDARSTEEQAAEIVDDASQTRDVAPVSTPETDDMQAQTTDEGAKASVTPQTVESETDEQKQTTPDPVDEPVNVSTEEEDSTPTSQEVATTPEDANQGEPEKTAIQEPVKVSTEEEDSATVPEGNATIATTTTIGPTDDQADDQKPNGGSGGGCEGICGTDGDGQSGTGGNEETTTSGGNCPSGNCPGDGSGNDPGDDCSGSSCPGDGPGTGPGDDPGDEPVDEPPCPPGWILDPFGNCKAPDPGPEGF